jgi:hypothetical protein
MPDELKNKLRLIDSPPTERKHKAATGDAKARDCWASPGRAVPETPNAEHEHRKQNAKIVKGEHKAGLQRQLACDRRIHGSAARDPYERGCCDQKGREQPNSQEEEISARHFHTSPNA